MKAHGIAIVPPPDFPEDGLKATPELLASCLAKYSRSNQGIENIFSSIDWDQPDRSVERIFKYVDYGHASIGGLTGGIAMTLDGCSMFLAYKLFELSPMADGQESSTRYIEMGPESLPSAEELGIPEKFAQPWYDLGEQAFATYRLAYQYLDAIATADPSVVRLPDGAPDKVVRRLVRNFALDRARYTIPLATRTNVALVMSARMWATTIRALDASPFAEFRKAAALLREELTRFASRLIRHSHADKASQLQWQREIDLLASTIKEKGVPTGECPEKVWVSMDEALPDFLPTAGNVEGEFAGKDNRYSVVGPGVRRHMVRFAWNNMAMAELRDLNRHRTGYRYTPLVPTGFYRFEDDGLPPVQDLLQQQAALISGLASEAPECIPYAYFLGTQTPFEHSTHLDKFIYEVELRTGMGAHYRYAWHLEKAARVFLEKYPHFQPFIDIGDYQPE